METRKHLNLKETILLRVQQLVIKINSITYAVETHQVSKMLSLFWYLLLLFCNVYTPIPHFRAVSLYCLSVTRASTDKYYYSILIDMFS